jgi:hypothetical protein
MSRAAGQDQNTLQGDFGEAWLEAVAAAGERIRLEEEGTMLVGHGAWVSLESQSSSLNRTTQAVTLPAVNTLDQPGLERMLKTYGVRRTTIVPDVDVWGKT